MKQIHNKKGVTLIELLVSLLILSIIATIAASLIFSSTSIYEKGSQSNLDKLVADEIYKELSGNLLYATKLTVAQSEAEKPKPAEGSFSAYSVRDGRLYLDGKDLFGEEFYHGRTLSIQVKAYDKSKLSIQILLLDPKGEQAYQTGSTITILNIQLTGNTIKGKVGTLQEDPILYFSKDEVAKPN